MNDDEAHSLLVSLLWNTKLDRSGQLASAGSDMFSLAHAALISVLKSLITEDADDVQQSFHLLSLAEAKAATASSGGLASWFTSKSAPQLSALEKAQYNAYAAELSALKTLLYFRTHAYMRGAYSLRTTWKLYESHGEPFLQRWDAEQAPGEADAAAQEQRRQLQASVRSICLLGAGLFLFFTSLVPTAFQWAVKVVGFNGDRELGLRYLRQCKDEGGIRADGALLMLSWIELFFVGDYATAGALLQDATARYSTGVFFLYLNGYLYRKQGMIDLALATFRRAYDASGDVRQLALACLYEIGWCQYLAMEWDDAVQSLDTFLHEHTSPSFRAFAAYQLGVSHAINNRWAEASAAFAKVAGWVRPHFTFDQFAARRSAAHLAAGQWTPVDNQFALATIHNEALRHDDALRALAVVADTLFHPAEAPAPRGEQLSAALGAARRGQGSPAAVFAYLAGVAERGLQHPDAARAWLERTVELEPVTGGEIYVVPHALVELGELAFAARDYALAAAHLRRAHSFANFDFDKPLFRRIANTLDAIEKIEAGDAQPTLLELHAPPVPGAFYQTAPLQKLAAAHRSARTLVRHCHELSTRKGMPQGDVLTAMRQHAHHDQVDPDGELLEALLERQFLERVSEDQLRASRRLKRSASAPLNDQFDWPLPARSTRDIINDLGSLIYEMYEKFYDKQRGGFALRQLALSSAFHRYEFCAHELHNVDPLALSQVERLCFFINLYNVTIVHALANRLLMTHHNDDVPKLTQRLERTRFFSNVACRVGAHTLTLDELEHGLLRCNRPVPNTLASCVGVKPFGTNDPRLRWTLEQFEPRVHFALNCGARSCPALEFYSPDGLDGALSYATACFLDEALRVEFGERGSDVRVKASKIFDWFRSDFVGNKQPKALLRRLLELGPATVHSAALERACADDTPSVKMDYDEYDWSVAARPTLADEKSIQRAAHIVVCGDTAENEQSESAHKSE